MVRHWTSLPVLSLVFLLAGCLSVREGTHRPIHVPPGKYHQTGVLWDNFVLTDDAIADKVAIENQGSRRTATGTLEVWAQVRNRTDFPLQVEARVQFYDSNRTPIESPSSWQRLMLPANTISTWSQTSLKTSEVAHYFGEIREGR